MNEFSLRQRKGVQIQTFDMQELPGNIYETWKDLIKENKNLQNPFFSPFYCQLISQCEQKVKITTIKRQKKIIGIFPYEIESFQKARPVGSIFCDYQGIISNSVQQIPIELILKESGIKQFRFDHVPKWQSSFNKFSLTSDVSWLVDIRSGFSTYAKKLKDEKRKILIESARKKRKMSRELGTVKFYPDIKDHGLLEEMLIWKSLQWEKNGWKGRFKADWEKKLMHQLLDTDEFGFKGIFSVLEANGQPVAMHLGLRSETVWHTWTTSYNPDFKSYSPGILKHIEMLKSCEKFGINYMDFGKEDFVYKRRLHTETIPLIEGLVKI